MSNIISSFDISSISSKISELGNSFSFKKVTVEDDDGEDKLIDLEVFDSISQYDADRYARQIFDLDETNPQSSAWKYTKSTKKYQELEFFHSNTEGASVIQKLNYCKTISGTVLLEQLLLHPTTHISKLKNRQDCLKFMIKQSEYGIYDDKNPKYSVSIEKTLKSMHNTQLQVLGLYQPDKDEFKQILSLIYFESTLLKPLNYLETSMMLYYSFLIYFTPVYGFVAPLVVLFSPYIIIRYVLKIKMDFMIYANIMKQVLFGKSTLSVMIGNIVSKIDKSMNDPNAENKPDLLFRMGVKLVKLVLTLISSSLGRYSYIIFLFICYCYSIYNNINQSIALNKILAFFHKKLNVLHGWLYDASLIYKKFGLFGLNELEPLRDELESSLNSMFVKQMLSNYTVSHPYSVFSNKGSIIVLFKRLHNDMTSGHKILTPIIKYLAHFDCWMGLAELVKNNMKKGHKVCYPEYIDPDINAKYYDEDGKEDMIMEPRMFVKDVWNICCENPVCNDLVFNQKDPRLMIITGPNGSGKSTYIKALMECVILAQTVGIGLASEMKFTPFNSLTTYLNIPDCQGKESLFQAEMNRCHEFLEDIGHQEDTSKFSFNIIDEIFVSTNYQEGISGAGAVVNSLSRNTNCLNIVITHFNLEPICKENVCYKYFTIDVGPEPDCKVESDFKIRDGVNKKKLALKLLKNKGFDNDLVKEANEIYNKLFVKKKEEKKDKNDKKDKKEDKKKDKKEDKKKDK